MHQLQWIRSMVIRPQTLRMVLSTWCTVTVCEMAFMANLKRLESYGRNLASKTSTII